MTRESQLAAMTHAIALCDGTHPDAEALIQAWLADHEAPAQGPQMKLLKESCDEG